MGDNYYLNYLGGGSLNILYKDTLDKYLKYCE